MKILQKIMDWYQGNNNIEKEPPKSGIRRVGYLLVNFPGKLIAVNLLFLICCIPVITIPAAYVALNRYLIKLFRDGYGVTFGDYLQEYSSALFCRLPLGILSGILLFYAYYLLSLAGNFRGSAEYSLLLGIGSAVLVIGILFAGYTLLMAAMLDLTNLQLMKNALILSLSEWKADILVVLAVLFIWLTGIVFSPWTLIPAVLFGFSVKQLLVCAALNPVIEKRILQPFEQQKQKM